MSRGRRYDDTPKLNVKKVIATIVAIFVLIMFIISIKNLFTNTPMTKDVSIADTYFVVHEDSKWGIIDNKGTNIITPVYDEMIVIPDKNTDLFICTYDVNYDNETFNTKVINKDGKEILTDYNNVQAIENTDGNNIWYENNILKFKLNDKYGLIDFKGKIVLDAEYDNIYALSGIQKNIIIEKDGKKGLVNTSMGEVIIEPIYSEIVTLTDTYENGYIVSKDGKYGIISADAKIIFQPIFDKVKNVTSDGYYAVVENGILKLINSEGKDILTSGFEDIVDINGEDVIIKSNNLFGVIKSDGTSLIKNEYEDLKFIYGNYYIAKKGGLYGIISTVGDVNVDFTYKNIVYVKNADIIEAENENYTTDLINREFVVVLSNVIVSELNVDDGYIRIRDGEEYNYYNFKFEKKTNKDTLASNTLFLVKEFGKYGYENKKGERIVDCIYDDAKEQNKYGYCAVKKDGVWGCLKSDGTVIVAPSINMDDYLVIDFVDRWHLDKELNLNVYTK